MLLLIDREHPPKSVTIECATRGHGRCKDADCACWCHPRNVRKASAEAREARDE